MGPIAVLLHSTDDHSAQLRAIISNLYMLIVQAHDYHGPGTQQAMQGEMFVPHSPPFPQHRSRLTRPSKRLLTNLVELSKTAQRLPTPIPLEIIQYVEGGRNPDIYTREFVEVIMRTNQAQKGRSEALAQFRDILGEQIVAGIPEMREDVRKVVEVSGGQLES